MGKAVEKKRKKKGRPSLLDLQKRSLRLQKQQEQQQELQKRNPNPNPSTTNPYARFPNPGAGRRTTRRNSNPEPELPSPEEDGDDAAAAASGEDDDDEDEPSERRKEKKLKLVLHLPHPNANSSDMASSSSESDGAAHKKRKIDAVGKQTESKNSSWKATEAPQGETSDLGPTTPLPDKKLLEFILDRLQKKDTYGVFSDAVDPDELPDYHDIIQHPMDFGTVRKRLSSGAYKYLEQFEKDVFLISSNAMRYNAPDTIYFRQARSIHELAKKSFENLRQESEDSEPEPKIVRRGRPPGTGKNNVKRPVGRPPAERAGSEFSSEASLDNVVNGNHLSSRNDLLRKGPGLHNHGVADVSVRTKFVHSSDAYALGSELKSERTQHYSGSAWKGSSKYGKNLSGVDENRRNTYKQYQLSSSASEFPVLTALDEDRKILVPVGLHMEYAYARSLARFAANLGPICWKIAAQRIEKVLPPGTKFGPGWVGECDAPQPFQHPLFSTPSVHPSTVQPTVSTSSRGGQCLERQEDLPINKPVGPESRFRPSLPSSSVSVPAVAVAPDRFADSSEVKVSSQLQQNAMMQPPINGFKVPFAANLPQHGKFAGLDGPPGNFGLEAVVAQAQAASTVLSNSSSCSFGRQWSGTLPPDGERFKQAASPGPMTNHGTPLPSSSERRLPVRNIRLQSSGSPIPGVVDSQQPDLALQL